MRSAVAVATIAVLALLAAGCAHRYPSPAASEWAPAYDTGWQIPDPTGTNFYKPAVSGGAGVTGLWP